MKEIISKLKYMKILSFHPSCYVKLPGIKEFLDTIENEDVKTVFVREIKEKNAPNSSKFLIYKNGLMYAIDGEGFLSLDDMDEAKEKGFIGAGSKVYIREGEALTNDGYSERSSDCEIFHFAKSLGYNDFSEFLEATSNRFGSQRPEVYREAVSLGLKDKRGYEKYTESIAAMKASGFDRLDVYEEALSLGLPKKDVYDEYILLQKVKSKYKFETAQETHLFLILNRKTLPREKKLEDIASILSKENPQNWKNSDSNYKAQRWYQNKFRTLQELGNFLCTNPSIMSLGTYYPERKVFSNFSDKIILVDGSNVAYNNGDKTKGDKPKAMYIKLVVEELKNEGFIDIKVFYDANLPHLINDREVLNSLEKENVAKKIPAGSQADDFLLKYAKENNAYLISNDQFKEEALTDPWVAQNISRIRITAMIDNDVVAFSKNHKLINLSSFKNMEEAAFRGFESMEKNEDSYRRYEIVDASQSRQYW